MMCGGRTVFGLHVRKTDTHRTENGEIAVGTDFAIGLVS